MPMTLQQQETSRRALRLLILSWRSPQGLRRRRHNNMNMTRKSCSPSFNSVICRSPSPPPDGHRHGTPARRLTWSWRNLESAATSRAAGAGTVPVRCSSRKRRRVAAELQDVVSRRDHLADPVRARPHVQRCYVGLQEPPRDVQVEGPLPEGRRKAKASIPRIFKLNGCCLMYMSARNTRKLQEGRRRR